MPPKPPQVSQYELLKIYDSTKKRWQDTHRPRPEQIWYEEVWYLLWRLGYIKENPDDSRKKKD